MIHRQESYVNKMMLLLREELFHQEMFAWPSESLRKARLASCAWISKRSWQKALVAGRTVDDLPLRAARAVRHLLQRLALRLAQVIPREVGDRAVERLAGEHADASDEGGERCRELNDEVGACSTNDTGSDLILSRQSTATDS